MTKRTNIKQRHLVPAVATVTDEGVADVKRTPPRLSEGDIKEIARGLVTGKYWTTTDPKEFELAFSFALLNDWSDWDTDSIGLFIGNLDEIAPRTINGLPMFFSWRIMHRDDTEALLIKWRQMEEALS